MVFKGHLHFFSSVGSIPVFSSTAYLVMSKLIVVPLLFGVFSLFFVPQYVLVSS